MNIKISHTLIIIKVRLNIFLVFKFWCEIRIFLSQTLIQFGSQTLKINKYDIFNPTMLTFFYVLKGVLDWHLSLNVSNGVNSLNISLKHHLTRKKKKLILLC